MNEPVFSELDFTITPEEIEQSIKTLKKNKAVGIDCISGEMIQCSSSHMMNGYVKLFNAILNTSHYPSAWKQGIIVNLFKSGQQHDPDNYRGLSINSCLAKVFNTIMNNRLNNFLIEKNIIDKSQIGFKKKARTSDHISWIQFSKNTQDANRNYTYALLILKRRLTVYGTMLWC